MKRMLLFAVVLVLIAPLMPATFAQDGSPETSAEAVTIEASDGLQLQGDFYLPESEEPVPGVILMHMLGSLRSAWRPLIPVLVDEYNFAVLNIDLRGHGETGGERDWTLAETDVQTAIDWLREQEGVDPGRISLVGASIGSNLAIRGWANDAEIATVVALSPGLDYRGVTTEDAVANNPERPIMLVASRDDIFSADSVNQLYAVTEGYTQLRMYAGSRHGTNLFNDEDIRDYLTTAIAAWLAENN